MFTIDDITHNGFYALMIDFLQVRINKSLNDSFCVSDYLSNKHQAKLVELIIVCW